MHTPSRSIMPAPATGRDAPRPRVRPVRSLIVLGAVAVAAILAATGLMVRHQREHEVARAGRDITALNRTLAEQTARAIQSADLILVGVRERLLRDQAAGYLMDERAVHTLLRARIDGVPQVRALALVDPRGEIIASSQVYPIAAAHAGAERISLGVEDVPDNRLHFGKPRRSPVDGSGLLPVCRRLPNVAGGPHGRISAAIAPDYFVDLYRSLGLGPGHTISLYLRDGALVASTDPRLAVPGTPVLDSALLGRLGDENAGQAGTRLITTSDRFVAIGEVPGFPLVVAVAATSDAALAEWQEGAALAFWGAAGVIVMLGLITLVLARQLRRGEALGEALQKSGARLDGIIGSALDGVVAVDGAQRIVLFNPAAEKIFRCSAAAALGTPIDRFLPRHTGARPAEGGGSSAAMSAVGRTVEVVGARADGEQFPAEVSISRLEDEQSGLSTAFVRDITERKRADEALRKFSRAIDQTASTIVITDPRGVIEYVNPRFVETTGYAADEAIGRRPSLLKSGHTSPEEYGALWQTIATGGVWQGEFHNRRKDGSCYWESAIISPIRGERGEITHFVAIKDDITARKEALDALRESHQQLRDMAAMLNSLREEEMTRIARELHDELGQKLTGMKMDLSWLEGRLSPDQVVLHDKLRSTKKLIDATVSSVRRISTGLRPLVLDDFGPVAAIEWLVDDFTKHSGIEVELELGMDELAVDERTATAIFRIVQESLTNVARHAAANRVEVSLTVEGGRLAVRINDDGQGMPDAAAGKGSGFGLMGIRERAHMCGGEFHLASRPGEGTAIAVTIPLPAAASGGLAR